MSAIARFMQTQGVAVFGYDKSETNLTDELMLEGMDIHFEDSIDLIPKRFQEFSERNIVIYTPAIPNDHKQLNYLREKGYKLFKRSEILGMISKDHFTVAVAGTHGKTTTTAIIAHLLKTLNKNFTAFLGGISTNYGSNFIRNSGEGDHIILVEADEYDRSFLRLFPNIAVITSADADHLDIYEDKENLLFGFKEFIQNIQVDGYLIINDKLDDLKGTSQVNQLTYGINRGQFFASDFTIEDGFFIFDLYAENSIFRSLRLGVPGFYNTENAVASMVVAYKLGITFPELFNSLQSFSGVKRRFEFIIRTKRLVFVDDYAHHPQEIESFLTSLKELYKERHLTVIFQPHLYSRTRDFASEFGRSLSVADRLILLPIYPAREEPIPGVNSALIISAVTHSNCEFWSKEKVLTELDATQLEVVATIGAGDIDKLVQPLKEKWRHEEVA